MSTIKRYKFLLLAIVILLVFIGNVFAVKGWQKKDPDVEGMKQQVEANTLAIALLRTDLDVLIAQVANLDLTTLQSDVTNLKTDNIGLKADTIYFIRQDIQDIAELLSIPVDHIWMRDLVANRVYWTQPKLDALQNIRDRHATRLTELGITDNYVYIPDTP